MTVIRKLPTVPEGADKPAPDKMMIFLEEERECRKAMGSDEGGIFYYYQDQFRALEDAQFTID